MVAKRKKKSLAELTLTKEEVQEEASGGKAEEKSSSKSAPTSDTSKRKQQPLRLNQEAWTQLKYLAFDQGRTSHSLLIEAVNDLFVKHGKEPVA